LFNFNAANSMHHPQSPPVKASISGEFTRHCITTFRVL
jgi:hypothetical protein